jgi:hypothetical protein
MIIIIRQLNLFLLLLAMRRFSGLRSNRERKKSNGNSVIFSSNLDVPHQDYEDKPRIN